MQLSKKRKRKASDLEPRRSPRAKTSTQQYIAKKEQLLGTALEELENLIQDHMKVGERLKRVKMSILNCGDWDDKVTNEWETS